MPLTHRELNRATLARQGLLERWDVDVAEAVRAVHALQAQAPPSPYVALWNRVSGLDPAAVDEAFACGRIVKATSMRVTLHALHADDHAVAHAAMQPTLRAARLHDRRFADAGVSIAEADALVPELLAFLSEPRSNQDVEAWLAERSIGARAWWALRQVAPVRHVVTGPPWSFGPRPAHVAADVPVPEPGDREAADEALAALVRRYLAAFGPASVADVAKYALVPRGRVRPVVEAMDGLVRHEGPDGVTLLDVADGALPAADAPAPARLLGMWEAILLAHHDRTRVLSEALRKVVIRSNGDVLPTVLVDGQVAGVWRGADAGIEVTSFRTLDGATWDALDAEAGALAAFLADRDPQPYARYHRWWDRLPDGEVRVLGA
jgi:hypothetical protein